MGHDLSHALRLLRKNPRFTLIAVVTLALGIGATTAIFSVVDGVVLAPLPYPQAGRLVSIQTRNLFFALTGGISSDLDLLDWEKQSDAFRSMGAASDFGVTLTGAGPAGSIRGARITSGLLRTLGVRPMLGRAFLPGEYAAGAGHEVLLSYPLWRKRFGGSRGILGKTVTLNLDPYTVVGVMPPNFGFPDQFSPLFWTPLALKTAGPMARGDWELWAVGRLKPGAAVARANFEIGAIEARIAQENPDLDHNVTAFVLPLKEALVGRARSTLLMLFGAVAFLLLIACVNVAQLLLARASGRRREMAIRAALGAGRGRIARQLLTESVLLGLIAAGAGLLFAWWALAALAVLIPDSVPRTQNIGIDGTVLAFALAAAVVTAILFGLAPAADLSQADVNDALKTGSLNLAGDRRGRRLRAGLATAEIALALVLAIGGGLLFRSLMATNAVNPGFNPHNLLVAQITLPPTKYKQAAQIDAYSRSALALTLRLPGVHSAALAAGGGGLPFLGEMESTITVAGRPNAAGLGPTAAGFNVSPGYLQTMQIPLLRGRSFTAADLAPKAPAQGPTVALIDPEMARRFWPGQDPIGQRFNGHTVVGVVGHVHVMSRTDNAGPEFYYPAEGGLTEFVAIRSARPPKAITVETLKQLRALDPDAVVQAKSMGVFIGHSEDETRFRGLLLGIFAALAVALAGLGIYGVISYSVAQRTHEFGIRAALGAEGRDLLGMIGLEAMRLAAAGIAIGLAAAFALTRVLASSLYGVQPTDPATFVAVAALLAAVVFLASYAPARRAARVDPATALRHE